MKITAAILVETGRPLEIAELDVPALKPGQLLVEVQRSGVCHTQVLESRGYRGEDRFLPHCLGHEAGGVVVDTGPNVTKVRPGDRVILSWIKGSGADVPGTVYSWNGRDVNAGAITTFSNYTVTCENRVTPFPDAVSMDDASILGCAFATGCGAVLNTACAKTGESLVVFGAGGVGNCAVIGARLSGCEPIIAVDVLDAKLALATEFGATHTINAAEEDPVKAVLAICAGGVDKAIEATGRTAVMAQAMACLRRQGGAAVIIGNARHGDELVLNPMEFNLGKRLLGTWGGDSRPDRDFPRFANHVACGDVDLSPLMSRHYSLEQINDALDDLESGSAARPIIDMSHDQAAHDDNRN